MEENKQIGVAHIGASGVGKAEIAALIALSDAPLIFNDTDNPARNEKGYPLLMNGNIDWELTSKEKQAVLESFEREEHGGRLKGRKKHATNYTPPKKRRK